MVDSNQRTLIQTVVSIVQKIFLLFIEYFSTTLLAFFYVSTFDNDKNNFRQLVIR